MIPETQTNTVTVYQSNDLEAREFGEMMVPKPCVYQSETLAGVQYYVGDNELIYDISKHNKQLTGLTLSLLSGNAQLVCVNGESASDFATYRDKDSSVSIMTDSAANGCRKTVIRECDADSRLIELYLDIEVLTNTLPQFQADV